MNPEGLNPGDKVVALSFMCQTFSVFCGVVVGSLYIWITTNKILYAGGGLLGGGLVGYFVGFITALTLFASGPKNTLVVKAGIGALPLALKGCLIPAILIPSILVALSSWILNIPFTKSFGIAFGTAIPFGIGWALLVSLL